MSSRSLGKTLYANRINAIRADINFLRTKYLITDINNSDNENNENNQDTQNSINLILNELEKFLIYYNNNIAKQVITLTNNKINPNIVSTCQNDTNIVLVNTFECIVKNIIIDKFNVCQDGNHVTFNLTFNKNQKVLITQFATTLYGDDDDHNIFNKTITLRDALICIRRYLDITAAVITGNDNDIIPVTFCCPIKICDSSYQDQMAISLLIKSNDPNNNEQINKVSNILNSGMSIVLNKNIYNSDEIAKIALAVTATVAIIVVACLLVAVKPAAAPLAFKAIKKTVKTSAAFICKVMIKACKMGYKITRKADKVQRFLDRASQKLERFETTLQRLQQKLQQLEEDAQSIGLPVRFTHYTDRAFDKVLTYTDYVENKMDDLNQVVSVVADPIQIGTNTLFTYTLNQNGIKTPEQIYTEEKNNALNEAAKFNVENTFLGKNIGLLQDNVLNSRFDLDSLDDNAFDVEYGKVFADDDNDLFRVDKDNQTEQYNNLLKNNCNIQINCQYSTTESNAAPCHGPTSVIGPRSKLYYNYVSRLFVGVTDRQGTPFGFHNELNPNHVVDLYLVRRMVNAVFFGTQPLNNKANPVINDNETLYFNAFTAVSISNRYDRLLNKGLEDFHGFLLRSIDGITRTNDNKEIKNPVDFSSKFRTANELGIAIPTIIFFEFITELLAFLECFACTIIDNVDSASKTDKNMKYTDDNLDENYINRYKTTLPDYYNILKDGNLSPVDLPILISDPESGYLKARIAMKINTCDYLFEFLQIAAYNWSSTTLHTMEYYQSKKNLVKKEIITLYTNIIEIINLLDLKDV